MNWLAVCAWRQPLTSFKPQWNGHGHVVCVKVVRNKCLCSIVLDTYLYFWGTVAEIVTHKQALRGKRPFHSFVTWITDKAGYRPTVRLILWILSSFCWNVRRVVVQEKKHCSWKKQRIVHKAWILRSTRRPTYQLASTNAICGLPHGV